MLDSVIETAETNRVDDVLAAPALCIEGISEPAILRYFETMNAGEYSATAALFAADGVMYPPFETAIEGSEAIADYLSAEAKGMLLQPRQGIIEAPEDDHIPIKVTGKVQTPLFGVNVNWLFLLNADRQIASVRIKLLASPQELLKMQR